MKSNSKIESWLLHHPTYLHPCSNNCWIGWWKIKQYSDFDFWLVYLQYQELERHFQLVPLRFVRLPNIYQFLLVWLEGVRENYILYSHRISPLWWVSKIFVNPPRCIVHQYWQNWYLFRFEMVLNRKGAYGLHKDWHSVFEGCSRPPPFW